MGFDRPLVFHMLLVTRRLRIPKRCWLRKYVQVQKFVLLPAQKINCLLACLIVPKNRYTYTIMHMHPTKCLGHHCFCLHYCSSCPTLRRGAFLTIMDRILYIFRGWLIKCLFRFAISKRAILKYTM